MTRIGYQMQAAVFYVSLDEGATMYDIAKRIHVGASNGTNNALGYDPIWRAIAAGLLVVRPHPTKRHARVLYTPEGWELTRLAQGSV